jgi:hypothetical protein
MPYTLERQTKPCIVCRLASNVQEDFGIGINVDCARCGDFFAETAIGDDIDLLLSGPKQRALASYIIRKMQAPRTRPPLTKEFFEHLVHRTLPSPAEMADNLIIWLGEQADGSPGAQIDIDRASPRFFATVGVVGPEDIEWIVDSLSTQGLLRSTTTSSALEAGARVIVYQCKLTARGWQRLEELRRAQTSSRYAFFARKFDNPELDRVFAECLRPAVEQTGFELRTVPQRAGLVDAIIEDDIRRCRFLIADLSDDNAGAYWEAGFAEGLGKSVIYVCCERKNGKKKDTHFDANHRHTVRWDLASLDQTATQLKAVIRNTLLGDAKLTD